MSSAKPPHGGPAGPAIVTRKPDIDYPCAWPYTVIGEEAAALDAAIAALLAGEEAEVARGHASRGGRYVSFRVVVQVRDEGHRDAVFRGLQAIARVRFVL